jgi:hypothetical protein
VNWLPAFRSLSFELQGPCSAFTSRRARIRYTQALALPAHNQKLVLRHVAFVLQQLFEISLERGLCFNHRVEGFLHLSRQIICIDVLPLQFFPCRALLQLGRTQRPNSRSPKNLRCTKPRGTTQLAKRRICRRPQSVPHQSVLAPENLTTLAHGKFKPMVPVATCYEPTFLLSGCR